MIKLSCFLLVVLGATPRPQPLLADDEIVRILQSWHEDYGAFAASEQYHYRCVSKRTSKTLDPSFDRSQFGEPFELGMEIFRRGPAWRMDAIRGGDFAHATAPAETRIFDGRAGILSQRQAGSSRFFQIYPANHDLETVRERVEPYADPLADVLGLSVRAGTASWALDVPPDVKPFDLASAQALGRFHVVSRNAERIEFRGAEGDELTLSVRHNYALARRTWSWTLETQLKCSLENRDWQQFSDGTWYPQVSKFVCSRRLGSDSEEVLYTVDYYFSARPASKPSDFQVTADQPGDDIEYRGSGGDSRLRTLKAGETIDLTCLAHDQLSIRWDDRDIPYSVLEKWSLVPLAMIAALLAMRLAGRAQAHSAGLRPQSAIWLALLLGAVFLLLIHLAMWLYQGGTKSDKALTSYSWTHNYLSDLGREYRYDEGDNHAVGVVFMLALGAAGSATILYAWKGAGETDWAASRRKGSWQSAAWRRVGATSALATRRSISIATNIISTKRLGSLLGESWGCCTRGRCCSNQTIHAATAGACWRVACCWAPSCCCDRWTARTGALLPLSHGERPLRKSWSTPKRSA